MMQLGFVSAIVPTLTLEQVFATAADIGYRCVEVMCWPPSKAERRYSGITHINVQELSPQRIEEIRVLQEKSGVKISGLGLLKVWKPIVDLAENTGVRIGIENCPMLFTKDEWPGGKNIASSPAIWRRLFSDLGSPNLGLNYDPSHMVFQCMDYLQPMRDFIDRIFHVHAKDVRVDQHKLNDVGVFAHPNLYHTPKLPGLGDIDWGKFFSVLGDAGYQGPVCVEVEDRIYEGSIENRTASLAQSYRYLSQFVGSE